MFTRPNNNCNFNRLTGIPKHVSIFHKMHNQPLKPDKIDCPDFFGIGKYWNRNVYINKSPLIVSIFLY